MVSKYYLPIRPCASSDDGLASRRAYSRVCRMGRGGQLGKVTALKASSEAESSGGTTSAWRLAAVSAVASVSCKAPVYLAERHTDGAWLQASEAPPATTSDIQRLRTYLEPILPSIDGATRARYPRAAVPIRILDDLNERSDAIGLNIHFDHALSPEERAATLAALHLWYRSAYQEFSLPMSAFLPIVNGAVARFHVYGDTARNLAYFDSLRRWVTALPDTRPTHLVLGTEVVG